MIFDLVTRLARIRLTIGYAATLMAVSSTLLMLGPQVQAQVIRNASTNVHNLAHGHLGTLLGSAFVTDAGPIYVWLPGLVCLLALAELLWRSARLTMVLVTGHIGATLLVAGGIATAIKLGWLPLSIARASDVGMSYGAVAVLGALTAAVSPRWRPAWVGWWVPAGVAAALASADFTNAGHAIALVLGVLVASRFTGPVTWTPVRYMLLGVGAAFGFLMLAHTAWSVLAGVGLGGLGAAAAEASVRARPMRRRLPVPAPAGS
jgi:hypothetical protein